jgi:hypothetical protein
MEASRLIPSLLAVALLASAPQIAPDAEDRPADSSIEQYRTPVEVLSERMIGAASKSVRFDWRKSNIGFGLLGSELLERNNFGSTRFGVLARRPLGNFMGELGISRAFTWGSDSTEKLALTPYRQIGRPDRYELDFNLGLPVAEGVATAWPGFFPATELVFSANAGFRYLYYPGSTKGENFLNVASTLISPRLSDAELQNLEGDRLQGMQIDRARYGLLAGVSLDVYFGSGGFLSPRAMVALPILSGLTDTGLGWWWELNLGMGWMF